MDLYQGKAPRELLVDQLHNMIVRKINCIGYTCFFDPPDRDKAILAMALHREWMIVKRLKVAVHEGLCRDGQACYLHHIRNPRVIPPDHVHSPGALGYAIKYGAVTKNEAKLIVFDHGETIEDAINWSNGLFEQALRRVYNTRPSNTVRWDPFRIVLEVDVAGNLTGSTERKFVERSEPSERTRANHFCESCPPCC